MPNMKLMKRWVLQRILIVNLRYYHMLPSLKHFGFKVAKLQFDNEHWIFLTCYSIGDSYRIDPYYLLILSLSSGCRPKLKQTHRIPA